ncbi:hypothetical protein V6N13_098347 [Hibiscus sabdariffa]|uniref:Uncharacterized protein n=1 Tax=Hibiscus sabdariffa TaxID=183260 RepID=A0ABR2EDW3_9ROSI
MAPSPSKSATPKQLKEHLQVQQDPFVLNIYLAERGHLVKCLSSNGRNGWCSNLCRPRGYSKKMALIPTRVLKSMLGKFVPVSDGSELSCCGDNKGDGYDFQIAEITPFGSMEPEKILTNGTCQKKCVQDKQIDLLSMLDKLSSEKVHHIITREGRPSNRHSIDLTENVKGNFVLATFPWKFLGKSLLERYTLIGFKEAKGTIINEPRTLRYCRRSQRLGNQKKPPLDHSAEKSTRNNDGTDVGNQYNYVQRFICLKNLGNQSSNMSSMGCSYAFEEWQYSKLQRKIGSELGDTIMDEIIEEVLDFLRQ